MHNQRIPYLIAAVAQHDDEQAFEELFRIYYPALLSFSRSILENKEVAEEICVDVLHKLWENRSTLPTIKNLSSYLYVAVKHACISYTRSKGYRQQINTVSISAAGETIPFQLQNQESDLLNKETMQQLNNAINSLPERCRLIFKLIKEDGLKYSEVASLLEISTKTVENQLAIATKKLTEVLRSYYQETKKKIS